MHAYDITRWRLRVSRSELNFLEMESQVDTEFIGSTVKKVRARSVKRKEEPTIKAETD